MGQAALRAIGAFGIALAACGGSTTRATRSCAVRAPAVVTATAVAGNRLTVHGERFLVCHDTNHGPVGPGMSDIPVVLSQGTHRETVARVDAHGARGAFTVFVRVPVGFHAGPANVAALDTHAFVVLP